MNCECENIRDLIADAITGILPPEQAKHLDEHLSACVDCRNYAEALRRRSPATRSSAIACGRAACG